MYSALFEMIGAFTLWTFSGFKGKYENYLEREVNYKTAILGGVIFVVTVMLVILIVKFIFK